MNWSMQGEGSVFVEVKIYEMLSLLCPFVQLLLQANIAINVIFLFLIVFTRMGFHWKSFFRFL